MLGWTIYSSVMGAVICRLWPASRPSGVRWVALITAMVGLALGAGHCIEYQRTGANGTVQFVTQLPWIPSLGIEYHLGADGISLVLVLLTGIVAVAGLLFSWNVERRVQEFFSLYLVLIGGVYGVFLSVDLFLLFVFYELVIIPKYFLIAIYGSTRKEYGAMKLVLYSFVGSALVLAGLLSVYVVTGSRTLNLQELANFPYSPGFQYWAFPVTFIGFAILAGLWPFHSWAPTGHVAAPTAASMLLAGVVMKLGAYGALRVPMSLFPIGVDAWRDFFAFLGVVGIVYGASVAWVQRDFKFVIGYSSVSHMGFVLLGLMAASKVGLSGAVVQMFSHGILAGLLFAVVGRMVYDRTHTRDLSDLGSFQLSRKIPFAAATFLVAGVASMGLPGFSGFVAEIQVLAGAWNTFPTFAILAGLGIVLGVVYIFRVLLKVFYGEAREGVSLERLPPISWPEKIGAGLLMASTLAVGLYPGWLLDLIQPSLDSPILRPLWNSM